VDRYAVGLSSSRAQATTVAHVELEERLARWYGYEQCLLFTTGYQAMVGTIQALADRDTALILDNLSHACILDGTFLAAGVPGQAPEVRYFNHNSVKSLERCLKTKERPNALVLMEASTHSMVTAPAARVRRSLRALQRGLALRRCARTGTLGTRGTGLVEATGMLGGCRS